MSVNTWLVFVATEFVLCLTPGLFVLSHGLRQGGRASAWAQSCSRRTRCSRHSSSLARRKRGATTLDNVRIVLTDRINTLEGQLVDDRGAPLSTGTVIVFPSAMS